MDPISDTAARGGLDFFCRHRRVVARRLGLTKRAVCLKAAASFSFLRAWAGLLPCSSLLCALRFSARASISDLQVDEQVPRVSVSRI